MSEKVIKIVEVSDMENPFPKAIEGQRHKGRRFRPHRLVRWKKVAEIFCYNIRPSDFKIAFERCKDGNGQYDAEAQAVWDFIRKYDIKSIVEIGRHWGGNSFLMACAAKNLENFLSVDLFEWKLTDPLIKKWMEYYKIQAEIEVCDSMNYKSKGQWDFVYIDGGHTEEIVNVDISNWKDRTKFIGFHDFADRGRKNKHRVLYPGVVRAIQEARDKYGWKQIGERGRSEVIFQI